MTQNEPRHQPISAKAPPTTGPINWATIQTPWVSASTRLRRAAPNTTLISANPPPLSSPPANPCTMRAMLRIAMSGASAQPTEPIRNTAALAANPLRRPAAAHRGPTQAAPTMAPMV